MTTGWPWTLRGHGHTDCVLQLPPPPVPPSPRVPSQVNQWIHRNQCSQLEDQLSSVYPLCVSPTACTVFILILMFFPCKFNSSAILEHKDSFDPGSRNTYVVTHLWPFLARWTTKITAIAQSDSSTPIWQSMRHEAWGSLSEAKLPLFVVPSFLVAWQPAPEVLQGDEKSTCHNLTYCDTACVNVQAWDSQRPILTSLAKVITLQCSYMTPDLAMSLCSKGKVYDQQCSFQTL